MRPSPITTTIKTRKTKMVEARLENMENGNLFAEMKKVALVNDMEKPI